MRNRITKTAFAALVVLSFGLGVLFFNDTGSPAKAAEILTQAKASLAGLKSVHIKALMRAPGKGDNFRTIGVDYDFVPVEIWKEFEPNTLGCWRIENPARVMVMDGNQATTLIRPNWAFREPARDFARWLPLGLADVDRIIDREVELAARQGSAYFLSHDVGADGRPKTIVSVAFCDFPRRSQKNIFHDRKELYATQLYDMLSDSTNN